ncbi:MAG: hypothetical protein MJE68_04790, partial [Proteobacteria bacterium]|nr:hypothetical protein [Pseudomonadota bacterium]
MLNDDNSVAVSANFTIVDDDTTVRLASSTLTTTGGTLDFTVSNDNGSNVAVDNEIFLDWSGIMGTSNASLNGTIFPRDEFNRVQSVTIPAGQSSVSVSVPILASLSSTMNVQVEAIESAFNMQPITSYSNIGGNQLRFTVNTPPPGTGAPPSGTTPPPVVTPSDLNATLDSTTYTVAEGGGVDVTILLDGDAGSSGQRVRVRTEETTVNPAVAGREYPVVDRFVTVPAGRNNTTYTVRSNENNVYYSGGQSNFNIIVATPGQSPLITAGTATVQIMDNDAIPELVIEGPSRVAPGRNGTFTVRSLTSVSAATISAVDLIANGSVTAIYTLAGDPTTLTGAITSNSSDFAVTLPPLADRVRFDITAEVPANASVEQDPIIAYLDTASSVAGTEYNITHNRGSLVATAQVSPGGLNPVAVNEVVLPQAVMTVVDQVGQTIASRSQNSFGDDGYTRGFTINGETPLGFASTLATREAAREASENPWDTPDTLGGGSLSLTDLTSDGELSLVLPLNRGEGGGSFTIWAEGFTRSLDGDQT